LSRTLGTAPPFGLQIKDDADVGCCHPLCAFTHVRDGVLLIKLIEALSEKTYTGKALKPSAQRVQKIDNLNLALKFVWDSGVEMKVKPQAENFVDGDVRYGVPSHALVCVVELGCGSRRLGLYEQGRTGPSVGMHAQVPAYRRPR
jgi:hypothetical protein